MSLWKDYFGLGEVASSGATPTDGSTPTRGLPASWYTSQGLYELERRALFSRKWLLTTHVLRLPNTGDWLQYKIANYPFVLVKDREGRINAFHNVCRHRAFPVVTEESGKSRIFSCKYHGWSYGLNGKLAKAPGYQELDGFDKSQNGLLSIHVHVDNSGFVWVNLDGKEKPEIAWEDDFKEIDLQPRFKELDFINYQFDHAWELEGEYNWKVLADKYHESYHGQTSHPDILALADATPEQIEQGLQMGSTYCFPNASTTVWPHFFFIQRFVPTSPTACSMRYEVYRHKDSSDEDFDVVNQAYKRTMSADKDLCTQAQKNLNDGVFGDEERHPRLEEGPLHFQAIVRGILQEHQKREEEVQQDIWPARQVLPEQASTSREDEDFCAKLVGQRAEIPDCSSMAGQGGCCSGGMGCQSGNGSLVY